MALMQLTPHGVTRLICPEGRQHLAVFDTQMRGLYVDVQASGRMAYRVRYQQNKRTRYLTLGDARVITVDEARQEARQVLRQVRAGADPRITRGVVDGITLTAFFTEQYLPYVRTYKRSWETDRIILDCHVLPAWGERALDNVTEADVARLVGTLQVAGYAPATINRVLAVVSYGYALALRWRVEGIAHNPVAGIRRLKENNHIECYLSPVQSKMLLACLERSRNPCLADIVAFMLYTGARKREVLDARWQDIHRGHQLWRIPHTKAGKARFVPLSQGALGVLGQCRRRAASNSPWIFANPRTGQPFVSIYHSWNRARQQAGLPALRLHDLRHSFASFLVNAGRSLYEVQVLLGHTNPSTTQRYAHLSPDWLREAVDSVPFLGASR